MLVYLITTFSACIVLKEVSVILKYIIVIAGYLIAICTSGRIVHYFIGFASDKSSGSIRESGAKHYFDVGIIIGKCENFLVITFILADAFTGSALIFTAKYIVRREDIKKDPRYYLGGTLVNFSYSVLIGYLIRIALNTID